MTQKKIYKKDLIHNVHINFVLDVLAILVPHVSPLHQDITLLYLINNTMILRFNHCYMSLTINSSA